MLKLQGKQERKTIHKALQLEAKINPINAHARLVCSQLSGCTEFFEKQVFRYLKSIGYAERIVIVPDRLPFSAYTPELTYRVIKGIAPVCSETLRGASIDDLLKAPQFECIKEIGKACAEDLKAISRANEHVYAQQRDHYEALIDLTVVESVFPQHELKERAILYVTAEESGNVLRADKILLDDDEPAYIEGEEVVHMMCGRPLGELMVLDAEKYDANVYVLTGLGLFVPSKLVADHVFGQMKMRYLKEHPDSDRDCSSDHKFIITSSNGHLVGLVPPGEKVPREMISRMMRYASQQCAEGKEDPTLN